MRGSFRADAVARDMEGHPQVELIKASDTELLLTARHAGQEVAALLAMASQLGQVREVAIRQASLENLFIKLTGRELRE